MPFTASTKRAPKRLSAVIGCALLTGLVATGCANAPGADYEPPRPATVSPTSAPSAPETIQTSPLPEPFRASPKNNRPRSTPRPLERQLAPGTQGKDVRELQARLREAVYFASTDLTDYFGDRTKNSVIAFQKDHGLPATGVVDQATWDKLLPLTAQPSEEELANRNVGAWYVGKNSTGFVAELQHRFHQLGLYDGPNDGNWNEATGAAARKFRAQIGLADSEVIDERAWIQLNAQTRNPAYSELWSEAPKGVSKTQELDPRCSGPGKMMCVSMDQRLMTYLKDGQPVLTLEARFGSPDHPTHKGDFKIWFKNWLTVSDIYGERTPMPYAMFFDSDRAFHYSQDFSEVGYNGFSHGCTQTYDYQALKWLYDELPVGTRVIVY